MIDYGYGVRLDILDRIQPHQLITWRNDYKIYRFCRQNDLLSRKDHSLWEENTAIDKSIKMYSIIDLNGRPVGVCGLTSIDLLNRNAEFSLYIGPNFQGEGLGKKALQSLVNHGFSAYGLNSIWGETFKHNPAAKIFLSVGFKKTGERRDFYFREGRPIDAHLYDILWHEWEMREQICFTQGI